MDNNFPKLATPISHLFFKEENARIIIEASDCLECRDHSFKKTHSNQEVFHCDLQPIQNLGQLEFNYLENIKKNKPDLKLISFHMATCYDAPTIEDGKFIPGGNKLKSETLILNASKNITKIKELFGSTVNIAIENNNYYKTEAYDFITDPEFISTVIEQNGINFLFDIAHARVSAFNQAVSFENYISRLPLDRLIQIHISRPGFNENGEIFDKHELPGDEEFMEVINLLKSHSTVKYLTIEYYRDANVLVSLLNRLKKLGNG